MKRILFWLVAILAPIAAVVIALPAKATMTAFWQQRTISAAAIAHDPQLADMQSWSLMTTYDIGRWVSAGVRATLPAGHVFYHHPLGGNIAPNPLLLPQFPALEFDTYVTDPLRTTTGILGGWPSSPNASFGGANDPIPGNFNVSWYAALGSSPPTGTFEIARFTFPLGVLPVILQGPPANAQSVTYTVNPDQSAPVSQIPEPAGAALICCAAAVLMRRRAR